MKFFRITDEHGTRFVNLEQVSVIRYDADERENPKITIFYDGQYASDEYDADAETIGRLRFFLDEQSI